MTNKTKKKIFQMIYQQYPFLQGDKMVQTFILGVLKSIQYDNDNRIENWGSDDLKEFSILIANTLIKFFAKYDDLTRALVKRG